MLGPIVRIQVAAGFLGNGGYVVANIGQGSSASNYVGVVGDGV